MATALDAKVLPKVKRAIDKVARSAVLVVESGGYDHAAGTRTDGQTTHDVMVTPRLAYKRYLVDGEMIQMSDTYVLAYGPEFPVVPQNGMSIRMDGASYRIVSVQTHSAGEVAAAYEMQLRGGGA